MAKRLLIAAGESASSPRELPFGVRELIDAADEILVVTPRQERGLLEQLQQRFGLPMTAFSL